MMEMMHDVMEDKESESKQETHQKDDKQSQQVEKTQDVQKSEGELKDDVFNQLTNLKSMKGHYILINRRQE